jgi:hypothetical protein
MRFKSAVEFLKPVAIGSGLLGGITLVRFIGASIVGYPLRSAGQAASAVGLAALGGAAAGLIYAVIGRPLRAHGAAGNYAAGVVTVAPYLVVIFLVLGRNDSTNKIRLDEPFSWVVLGLVSLLAGALLGREFQEKDDLFED